MIERREIEPVGPGVVQLARLDACFEFNNARRKSIDKDTKFRDLLVQIGGTPGSKRHAECRQQDGPEGAAERLCQEVFSKMIRSAQFGFIKSETAGPLQCR